MTKHPQILLSAHPADIYVCAVIRRRSLKATRARVRLQIIGNGLSNPYIFISRARGEGAMSCSENVMVACGALAGSIYTVTEFKDFTTREREVFKTACYARAFCHAGRLQRCLSSCYRSSCNLVNVYNTFFSVRGCVF